MSGRYAKLKKDWLLRGWTDVPCAVVNWTDGDQREMKKRGLYVAECCNGRTNFDSIAFLPIHRALLDKLIEEGIAEPCSPGDSIDPCQSYRKAENPRLTGLHWSVTGLCNLNCRHCYMEAPSRRYGELPFDDMLRLIEQFELANVADVSLTGGEPFVRKDLFDLMEVLARKRIRVSQIYTNGLLVTDDVLRAIKDIGHPPGFQISFDGCGAHDWMRGTEGIEADVIEAIRKVGAAGLEVVIATSVGRAAKDCLGETYELLKGLGVVSWRIAPPQQTGNWRGKSTDLSLDEEAEMYAPLVERWLKDDRPFYVQMGGFFRGIGKVGPREGATPDMRFTPDGYDCGACREKPYLLPDGTLLPCPGYTDTALQGRMPNILREGLPNVWSRSILRTIADMKKSDLLAKNDECRTCEHFEECGMGCRASAVAETGDLMAKDPIACEMWKKGYRKRFRELAGMAT